MTREEDVQFLRELLEELREGSEALEHLIPPDLIPYEGLEETTEEMERCARLADQYEGFDGNVFRNLDSIRPWEDGCEFKRYEIRHRKRVSALPRLIAAIEASSSEVAPPQEPIASSKRVYLFGPNDDPVAMVDGKKKSRMTKAQYDVVLALLKAKKRLTKDQLGDQSKHEDARRILDRLIKKDPDWAAVISMAGQTGGGYGIS